MRYEKLQFVDELRIIPHWVIGLAVALFVVGQVVAQIVHVYTLHKPEPLLALMGVAAGAALVLDVFLMLFGYVNRDAKRRGMNAMLWTLLAILVPYLIGVIIYFLLREPLPYNCPQCSTTVSARFNFCPNCKYNLRPACPQCKHDVRTGDKYCLHCAHELKGAPAA